MSEKAKITYERVKLSITGSDHPVPYLNTMKTDTNTIQAALDDFNAVAPVDGELFPDYKEPEYLDSNFGYINPERLCFEVSELYLDNNGCIYGTVSFLVSNQDELDNILKLIEVLDKADKEAGLFPGFGMRAMLDQDEDRSIVHHFAIIGFDILRPEQINGATPFPIAAHKLQEALDEPKSSPKGDTIKEKGMVPLSDKQLTDMLELQDKMNARVRPDWKGEDPFPYIDAVICEGAEARDHFGWKWWKKQVPDLPQVKMELVDIWHFYLSEIILSYPDSLEAQFREIRFLSGAGFETPVQGFLPNMNRIIRDAAEGHYNIWCFNKCMEAVDFTWDELYRWYIGKNVLNFFRQDNGYKEGTYQKIWKGREDNEVLFGILDEMDPNTDDVQTFIYDALSAGYHSAFSDPA